ncbi:DUF296 domain-containing protein [Actinopolymorpha sp. B17G11]|uniref:PCC domain-containing protein n=1 Tax=Actinopolymorpha sp. B17G11 TaxID=3160861 RepID=UPI0032E39453
MSVGGLIRDLRASRGWSQGHLALMLCEESGRPTLTHEDVSRWERGKVIPSRAWLEAIARLTGVSSDVLTAEARLDRVRSRDFLSLAALTAAHGSLAADMAASVAGRDAEALKTVQTTHGCDMVVASLVDSPGVVQLRRWMFDGSEPVLRVNAAGILAKLPGQDSAADVARVLQHDDEARDLYMTAVLSRVCAMDWTDAARLAADPLSLPERASFLRDWPLRSLTRRTPERDGAQPASSRISRHSFARVPPMHVIEVRNAELLETLTREAKDRGIASGAVVSLIGAVDSFTVSTMPADDATKDTLTDYALPAELSGTGEITDGAVHVHAVMAVEGDRAIAGHVHRANVGTWFVRAYVLPS